MKMRRWGDGEMRGMRKMREGDVIFIPIPYTLYPMLYTPYPIPHTP
jgi:hypothetical protein